MKIVYLIAFCLCINNIYHSQIFKRVANDVKNQAEWKVADPIQDNGILGEWKLLFWVKDKNENKQLEEGERKDPITGVEDYMKLNSDGSCLYLVFKQKGRYEVNTNSDGKKTFTIIDVNNKRSPKGHIYSVTKDEFILLDGQIFRVYKRI